MYTTCKWSICAIIAVLLIGAAHVDAAEFRGIWIHAWDWGGSGIRTPEETTNTLNYAKAARCNAVFVEVRKTADALYDSALEPRATNIAPGYDPLADIITKAHALGMEVHVWIVANRVWVGNFPADPNHLVNAHRDWLMKDITGSYHAGGAMVWSDPGHPDAAQRLADVCDDILSKYNVDGIHLDYIRYPSAGWGFNDVAVQRFRNRYGGEGYPSSVEPRWFEWCRKQVNHQVRKVYINTIASKPNVKVSASVWRTAGTGYSEVLQDWDQWMAGHYLDFACPMSYTADRALFQSMVADGLARGHGRHVYIIQGSIRNTIPDSMNQLKDIRTAGGVGLGIYSYQETNTGTLDQEGFKQALISEVFTAEDVVPILDWKTDPTTGILRGKVTCNGQPVDGAIISIAGKTGESDGKGDYGVLDIPPGTGYTVTCSADNYDMKSITNAVITAGQITTLNIALDFNPDTTPPVISSVTTSEVGATSVWIQWNTDTPADSQVEFGLDTRYGNLSALNSWWKTSHRTMLVGLRKNTTYHYRVISKKQHSAPAVSVDHTFTTTASVSVPDIIIDNNNGGNTFATGGWNVGMYAGGYGPDYCYSPTNDRRSSLFKWIPDIAVAGNYAVSTWYLASLNRSARSPFVVHSNSGDQTFIVNQQQNGSQWNLLGTFPFSAGRSGYVMLHNFTDENGLYVIADAVKFSYVGGSTPVTITGISVGVITDTRATIQWTTSRPADTLLLYGLTGSFGNQSIYVHDKSTSHTVTLTGLEPDTTCHYQCQSADDEGNLAVSATLSFTTARRIESPAGFIKPGWNLVSVPADPVVPDPLNPESPTAPEVFGEELAVGTSFQWWKSDHVLGGFQLYWPGDWTGPILRGRCYWLLRDPGLPPTSFHYPVKETSGDFILSLGNKPSAPYWIMFGTPFESPVPCTSISFSNPNYNGGSVISWTECQNSLVEAIAVGYDAASSRYFNAGVGGVIERSSLDPWHGYWLLVNRPGPLTIYFPKP